LASSVSMGLGGTSREALWRRERNRNPTFSGTARGMRVVKVATSESSLANFSLARQTVWPED
jgi:hypothetical protein